MVKRRNIHFQWDPDHDYPLRIVRDPWDEGLPQTTLSLTKSEAEDLVNFIHSINL